MAQKSSKRELLSNAFLLQLAFGIGCVILLCFVLKGYNNFDTILMMPWLVRAFALLSAVLGICFLFLWQRSLLSKPEVKYRDVFLYSISFSLGCLYLLFFHKGIHLNGFLAPWVTEAQLKQIFTTTNAMKSLFYIIGIYILIAFIAYIIRYNMCGIKKK